MRKISKKLVRNLTKDYLEGARTIDISRKYGISCPTIYKYTNDILRRFPYTWRGIPKKKAMKIVSVRNKKIYDDLPYANVNDLNMSRLGNYVGIWIEKFGLVSAKDMYEENNYGVSYLNYLSVLNKIYYKGNLKKIKFESKIYHWKQDDYLHGVRDANRKI